LNYVWAIWVIVLPPLQSILRACNRVFSHQRTCRTAGKQASSKRQQSKHTASEFASTNQAERTRALALFIITLLFTNHAAALHKIRAVSLTQETAVQTAPAEFFSAGQRAFLT